jgi:hypothetical protein
MSPLKGLGCGGGTVIYKQYAPTELGEPFQIHIPNFSPKGTPMRGVARSSTNISVLRN